MIVTTSYNPSESVLARANELAVQLQAQAVPRQRLTISGLQRRYGCQDMLVVTEEGLKCYRDRHPVLFFHPGSSMFRIKRMLASPEREPMLDIPDVRSGDTVIDCTAGLCSDAITFSYAVGAEGKVTAIEADRVVSLLIEEGLKEYETGIPEADAAMRRISVVHGHHLDVLRRMPAASADIVYFDPMFRSPVEESSGISPLRNFACEQELSPESIAEARRVARRTVVLKELRGSPQFARLGFAEDNRPHSKIAFGVIRAND